MASKRHSPPLFEVLERQSGRVDRPQGEAPVAPPPPAPSPARPETERAEPRAPGARRDRVTGVRAASTTAAPSGAGRHPGAADPGPGGAPAAGRGEVRVPLAGVWTAIVIAVGVAFVTWTVGYNVGYSSGQAEQASALGLGGSQILDPLTNPGGGDAGTGRDVGRATERDGRNGSAGDAGTGLGSSLVVIGVDGREIPDPRRDGHNYLALAVLPEPEARSAVRYLGSQGAQAIAVLVEPRRAGVDSRGNSGNNPRPATYEVFSLDLAVPSGQFRQTGDERERLVRALAEIGRTWLQRGGASDFSKPQWKRYDAP